jgi:hypothetical protein
LGIASIQPYNGFAKGLAKKEKSHRFSRKGAKLPRQETFAALRLCVKYCALGGQYFLFSIPQAAIKL